MPHSSDFSQYGTEEKTKFLSYLLDHITRHKAALYDNVVKERTRHITLVAENIYSEQNATALVRTAECLGIQDVYVIEEYNKFKVPKKIASGAAKWVDIHRFNKQEHTALDIVNTLKSKGYKIVCTSPNSTQTTSYNIDLSDRLAIFFGEEEPGLSAEIMAMADVQMHIPMYGFTESLNVSVSAGIILSTLVQRLRDGSIEWQLSHEAQLDLKLHWICNSIKGGREMMSRWICATQ